MANHSVTVDTMDDEITNYIRCDECDFAAVVVVEHLVDDLLVDSTFEVLNRGDRIHSHPFIVPGAPSAPHACRL